MKEADFRYRVDQLEWYGDIEDLERIFIDQLGAIIVDNHRACGLW